MSQTNKNNNKNKPMSMTNP